jgi:hypothetical protein
VYGAARSGARVDTIADDSQLLEMDVTSEESVAAAVALILRKHKVRDGCLPPLVLVSHSKKKKRHLIRFPPVSESMLLSTTRESTKPTYCEQSMLPQP